jgi:beta-lactamase regulating signal transducer with metallopeptidase domain
MATLFELAARLQAAGTAEGLVLLFVKATLILAIARLLLLALPRASAAMKHAVATAALTAIIAMPLLTALTPSWYLGLIKPAPPETVSATAPGTDAARANTTSGVGALGENEGTREPGAIGTAKTLARATGLGDLADPPLTVAARAISVTKASWKGMIVISLMLISALMLLQMGLGVLGVWFVARRAEELTQEAALRELDRAQDHLALAGQIRLLRSSRISVPVIWGFFRPVLLLPADVVTWPIERLRVVLMHELAHLKRLDGISLLITRAAVSFFWYHPLAWSLERAGRTECERACDDLVLANGTKPSEYADHLLAIARNMPTFDPFRSVTLAMSRKSQLEGRLLSILQPHVVRRIFTARGVAMACAVALMLVVPISAVRLAAQPQKAAPDAVVYAKQQPKSDSEVTVTPDVEAIGDYFLAKLGKTGDKFARAPKNGKEWYERAYDLYHADRYAEAADAFQRAAQQGYRNDTSLYNAACSYALNDDKENALKVLAQAIEAGWDDMDHIAEDSDFDPIRSDPRFGRVINDASNAAATKRLTETMERYEDLQSRTSSASASASSSSSSSSASGGSFTFKDGKFKIKSKKAGGNWYAVGLDLLRLRKIDESIDAFQQSIKANHSVANSTYNIACAYSLKGDVQNGLDWLAKAIDAGFSSGDKLDNDPDIRALRSSPRFRELRELSDDLELKGCCDNDDDDEYSSWREAVSHHRSVTQKHPNSGRAWFNLGYSALQARDYATGVDAFQRAINLGHRVGTSSYNTACGYALRGDKDAAFAWLDRARTAGFELHNYITRDEDLESLRDDPRYAALKKEVRADAIRLFDGDGDFDFNFDFDFDND